MCPVKTALVHYSAPPVTGGVESVMLAQARVMIETGYPVTIIAGKGEQSALPDGAELVIIPEMDTQHPEVLEISAALEKGEAGGRTGEMFQAMRERLVSALRQVLKDFDVVIVHNVFSKHFNLPLTAALTDLLEEGTPRRWVEWTHDLSWTSPNSRSKVFEGFPWDLLRTYHPGVVYVAVSEQRQDELAGLLGTAPEEIEVVYNGVDPCVWFGLSPEGEKLVRRLDLLAGDLILLMPVRVTQAKNIELAEQVLAALKKRGCKPRLVVSGPPDPHSEDSLHYYQSLLDLRGSLGLENELSFVYEAGPEENEPYIISQQVVADLLRVSDVLFMPSHREGFGMPVLEAGLVGVPVVSSEQIPAAREIGGKNVYLFGPQADADEIARLILEEATSSPASRFRRQVRQKLTWERIFREKIEPILQGEKGSALGKSSRKAGQAGRVAKKTPAKWKATAKQAGPVKQADPMKQESSAGKAPAEAGKAPTADAGKGSRKESHQKRGK